MNSFSKLSKGLAVLTWILIVAGGLVTSTESGLSVPDWPLSYGSLFPPMIGGIRFEHTHRLIAGVVLLVTLALMVLAFRVNVSKAVRRMVLIAMGAVVLQAVLGGITVLYYLPPQVSILHACLAQTFFCLVAAIAWMSSAAWNSASPVTAPDAKSTRKWCVALSIILYLQLIMGAWTRHSGTMSALAHHVIGALIIFIVIHLMVWKAKSSLALHRALMGPFRILAVLVLLQIVLGLGAAYYVFMVKWEGPPLFWEVILATAHQSFGALILCVSVLLSMNTYRFLQPSR